MSKSIYTSDLGLILLSKGDIVAAQGQLKKNLKSHRFKNAFAHRNIKQLLSKLTLRQDKYCTRIARHLMGVIGLIFH